MVLVATQSLRDAIAAELPDLVCIRRDLHAHPELGYHERRTSRVVQEELGKAGVSFKANLAGGTGVLGHLPAAAPGSRTKAVGLRADMDALPITEETGAPHCSTTPGTMHACGHDGHTTILIGAARVLAKLARYQGLPRPVSLCFQPAEEGGGGAARMIEDGCLNGSVIGPPIEHMFGLHGWPRLPLGHVATRPGPMLAAVDNFEITVRGVGCHAAFPHVGRDPIVAAAAIIQGLQTIVARNISATDPVVISVTQIHAGTTHNIIPDEVKLGGTVRTLAPETRPLAQRRVQEVVSGIAAAHGCQAAIDYQAGYPVTQNDPAVVKVFEAVAGEALGAQLVHTMPTPVMGAEDFSYYCHQTPSCFFVLGLLPPGQATMPDLHQPTFDFNDDAIATGVELFCRLALRA